jgi:hypothetical protein
MSTVTPERFAEAAARINAAPTLAIWLIEFEREAEALLHDPATQAYVERELREIWRKMDPKGRVPTVQRERIFTNAKEKARTNGRAAEAITPPVTVGSPPVAPSTPDTPDDIIAKQPQVSPEPNPQPQATGGIPLFITAAQKQALRDHGYTDEAIFEMKPEMAHQILGRDDQPDERGPSAPENDKAPYLNGTDTPISDHHIPRELKDVLEIFDWKNQAKKSEEAPKTAEAHTASTTGTAGAAGTATPSASPPVTLTEWLSRDLPEPDPLMGHWLTTTTRAIFNAPTGIGKSMSAIALGMSVAAGCDFLGWKGIRPARVLYIDGEMSRRLLKQRLADEATRLEARLAGRPDGFYPLSREDYDNFAPLNTKEGQTFIKNYITQKIELVGHLDLAIFDNIMSLILGDMRDEESWRQTLPLVFWLTTRSTGQLWIHHTGHNESHGYGTKTREWLLDCVLNAEPLKRADTDVSFNLNFNKARNRTPATRADFADVQIALVNNVWTWESSERESAQKISPLATKYLDALRDATIGSNVVRMNGCPTATLEAWRAECVKKGLIEIDAKPESARSLFSKYKRELIGANRIGCNETMAWTIA